MLLHNLWTIATELKWHGLFMLVVLVIGLYFARMGDRGATW